MQLRSFTSKLTGPVTPKMRVVGVVGLLVLQTALFMFFLGPGPQVVSDNVRYEWGGWSLATKHKLSLPYAMSPDPVVREWVCSRRPDACADGTYPSAQYPPGYQFFIAALYAVFGRSLWAIVLAQLALLWLLFAAFERLAANHLSRGPYALVMAIAATYPFLARQATFIMADHLHAVLMVTALAVILTARPGWWTFVAFGALFGAATFTRTYSVVCVPFIYGWPRIRRAFGASRRQWAMSMAVCVLPFVLWTARNAYWFGRFIPFSTTGLGVVLYANKLEAEVGEVQDPQALRATHRALFGGGDPTNYEANRILTRDGVAWIRAHPATMAGLVIRRIPRLWISKGVEGQGASPWYPVSIAYLGGLLGLGVAGMWLRRHDDRWKLPTLVICLYWAFLLMGTAEARRTLPLRLPMLIFAGFAVTAAVGRTGGGATASDGTDTNYAPRRIDPTGGS